MTLKPRDITILAIDDTEEDGRLNEIILGQAGFKVVPARSAREARALLLERSFEVLLVDLRLPDGEGIDLLQAARTRDPHCVAVILTGFASTHNAVAALKAGAYDFLTKPCIAETLVATMDRAAEKYLLSTALAQRSREIQELNETLDRRVRDATHEIFSLNEKLKRTIADLIETNNDQTRALEEMAHELKNPLSIIYGYCSFLLRSPMEEWTPAELKKTLSNMYKNAGHMQLLIEELLDSARISSRKIVLKKKIIPALQAVQEAADDAHIQAEEARIQLSAECEENCTVSADPARLRQILSNLLTNAIKFTPSGGKVVISAVNSPDGGVLFTVSDNGKGMDPEALSHIFERFFQVSPKGEPSQGLGLGLNIVDGLVRLHNGRVWAESEVAKGSKFFVFLPEVRVPATTASSN